MLGNQRKSSNPKSSGSDKKKASEKEEEKLPKKLLNEIAEDVSSYLKKFSHYKKYEKDITKAYKKYYPTADALPDCWPVEFINIAWRKTKQMHRFSGGKKCWSLAILFQVMKRSQGYDEREREAQTDVKKESQQSGGDPSANETVYIRIPFSEMIDGKECYISDTVAEDKESKTSDTYEKNKESKASGTDAMDIVESCQNKVVYKLIDKVPSPTQILPKMFYITLYDNQTRNAAWVYEILNKSTKANNNVDTTDKKFKDDLSVHPLFRPSTNTYEKTGYDRGHLAAAHNHSWCQKAYKDTYFISNAVPQQGGFNSGIWLTLEKLCRKIAEKKEVRNVHVYTGPLYLSSDRESEDKNDQNKRKKPVKNTVEEKANNNDQVKRKKLEENTEGEKANHNDQVKRKKPEENTEGEKANHNDQKKSKKHMKFECLGGKAVPTHLFKVIIVENNDGEVLAPQCYKMPNDMEELDQQRNKMPNGKELQSYRYTMPSKNSDEMKKIEAIKRSLIKMEPFKATIKKIQTESGLIFEDRKDNQTNSGLKEEIKEEITDETYKVKWTDKNHESWKNEWIVKVSGSYTDHSDRAVLH